MPLFRAEVDPTPLPLGPPFEPVLAGLPPDLDELGFDPDRLELFEVEVDLARPFDLAELRDDVDFDLEAEPFELFDPPDLIDRAPLAADFDFAPLELFDIALPDFEDPPEAARDDDVVLLDEPDLADREEAPPVREDPADADFLDLDEPPDEAFPDLDVLPVEDRLVLDDPPDDARLEPEVLFAPVVFLVEDPDFAELEPDFEPEDFDGPDPDLEPEDFFDEDDLEPEELFAVAIFLFPRIILCF